MTTVCQKFTSDPTNQFKSMSKIIECKKGKRFLILHLDFSDWPINCDFFPFEPPTGDFGATTQEGAAVRGEDGVRR